MTITVAGLVILALLFGCRQVVVAWQARRRSDLSDEDRAYLRGQSYRRLAGCALMLVLAGVLVGWFYLEPEYRRVTEERQDKSAPINPDEKEFVGQFVGYWGIVLGIVFVFGLCAVLDLLATLKYGIRKQRQLRTEHRAVMEEEVRRIRRQRNGHR